MRKLISTLVLSVLMVSLFINTPVFAADTILFVSSTGVASGSCENWGNACTLQYALSIASGSTEIWVQAGTYTPGSLRSDTFALKNEVELYGGFTGIEMARGERDWETNLTTLSGDIPGNNSYHVVTGSGTNSTAILDGFLITQGQADGGGPNESNGGGMLNIAGSPTITNVTFQDNYAANDGGGMFNGSGSSPTLTNAIFNNNEANKEASAYGYGGGMHNDASSPLLTNVRFSNNEAAYGGGLSNINGSAPSLIHTLFELNQARSFGGGVFNNTQSTPNINKTSFIQNSATRGGGFYNVDSTITITNALFYKNGAGVGGGGVLNFTSASATMPASITIINSTFYGNYVTNADVVDGGGLVNESSLTQASVATLINNIFWGNTALNADPDRTQIANVERPPSGPDSVTNITYSIIQFGGWPGNGNLTSDPRFVDAVAGDLSLQAISPAINSGTNTNCPLQDILDISRPQGSNCDMGAYESTSEPITSTDITVTIGNTEMDIYTMSFPSSRLEKYTIANGPVLVESDNGANVVASLLQLRRPASTGPWTGITQLMAIPDGQLSHIYVFPYYNATDPTKYNSINFSNFDDVSRDITVTIAGVAYGPYTVGAKESYTIKPNVTGGPVVVSTTPGAKIIAQIYELKRAGTSGKYNGQSQMMGMPVGYLTDTTILPWYNNTLNDLDATLIIANAGAASTQVTIRIAGDEVESFPLPLNTAILKKYAVSGGPVVIESDGEPIVASLLQLRRPATSGGWTGITQLMAIPDGQLSHAYVLPYYDATDPTKYNSINFSNFDNISRDITVTIAGVSYGPFTVGPQESYTFRPAVTGGPVIVSSTPGAKIIAQIYELKRPGTSGKYTGQSQMMGMPIGYLTDTAILPWYNNTLNDLDATLIFGVP